ncbi:radical SAM/SPASM domain-containing protein [Streptomyces sp. NPDC001739]
MHRATLREVRHELLVQHLLKKQITRLPAAAFPLLTAHRPPKTDQEVDFLERSRKRGWIDHNGNFNGEVRHVNREPWLRRLQIEVGLTCNFSCDYCYSGSAPTRPERLSGEVIANLLQQADALGTAEVCLTGGEFLIHPAWKEILREGRRLGLVIDVHTNGYRLNDKAIEYLVENGVRQVQVTMESHSEIIHEEIRGIRGSWSRTVANIKAARNAGLQTKVITQVHRKNIETIDETARWIIHELQSEIYLDRIVGGSNHHNLQVTESEFWQAVAPLYGIGASATRICTPHDTGDPQVEPECGVAHSFVYVTADGEIALCPTMTSRESTEFAGPNIREVSLSDAWHEHDLFTENRGLNCENTSHCPAAKKCTGGCRSNAYAMTGNKHAPDVIACNVNKNPGTVFVDFLHRYDNGKYGPVDISV